MKEWVIAISEIYLIIHLEAEEVNKIYLLQILIIW